MDARHGLFAMAASRVPEADAFRLSSARRETDSPMLGGTGEKWVLSGLTPAPDVV
jgi:hypothetical protein